MTWRPEFHVDGALLVDDVKVARLNNLWMLVGSHRSAISMSGSIAEARSLRAAPTALPLPLLRAHTRCHVDPRRGRRLRPSPSDRGRDRDSAVLRLSGEDLTRAEDRPWPQGAATRPACKQTGPREERARIKASQVASSRNASHHAHVRDQPGRVFPYPESLGTREARNNTMSIEIIVLRREWQASNRRELRASPIVDKVDLLYVVCSCSLPNRRSSETARRGERVAAM